MLPGRDSCKMEKYGIEFVHINGCLFKISPMKKLQNFKERETH